MMTIEEFGAIGEAISGIAVLVTLFYLSIQVRHVRQESQRSSLIEANRVYNDIFLSAMTSPELAKVLERSAANYEALENWERIMLTQYLSAMINACEVSFDAIEHGDFDAERVGSAEPLIKHFFDMPGAYQFWAEYGDTYTPPFKAFVSKYVEQQGV